MIRFRLIQVRLIHFDSNSLACSIILQFLVELRLECQQYKT